MDSSRHGGFLATEGETLHYITLHCERVPLDLLWAYGLDQLDRDSLGDASQLFLV